MDPDRHVVGNAAPARGRQRLVAALVAAVTAAVSFALTVVPADADPLGDRQARVSRAISQTRHDLNESSKALNKAAAAAAAAESRLAGARARLAQTRQELAAAKARDEAIARQLKKVRAALAAAKAAVRAGQRRLDAQHAKAGQIVRDQYQQQTNLLPLAALMGAGDTADLQTRAQWSVTLFDTAQAQLDRLEVIQQQLDAAKKRQAALEAKVAENRREAAANLKVKLRLTAEANAQAARIAGLVRARRAAESAAARDVASDKRRYRQLVAERSAVESRISARIARQRHSDLAKQRRTKPARRSYSKVTRRADTKVTRPAPRKRQPAPRRTRTGDHGFSSPVSAPITSAFGMRFHPVLRYWKLHDGTDFGAGCGTAIRAPYAGRVAERYYNGGYGNRLMIDHGRVDGTYVTTGYNHAIRYVVGVGQRVRRGQVIGYVGTTGYSTGCHLHLMVWLNGRVSNPMSWF